MKPYSYLIGFYRYELRRAVAALLVQVVNYSRPCLISEQRHIYAQSASVVLTPRQSHKYQLTPMDRATPPRTIAHLAVRTQLDAECDQQVTVMIDC